MKPISRSSGRSSVAAAAYRAGEKLTNERDGRTHDFTNKQGVECAEIILPKGVNTKWALDRSTLWNAVEKAEKRKDARVAREFEVALPHELNAEQRLELTREFAQELADSYGSAVDFAIHSPHGKTDIRNHHAHILMTTRKVEVDGLGDKTNIERENKWLLNHDLPTTTMQLKSLRQVWEECSNRHLAMAGHSIKVDHRSHEDRGLEIEPTRHMGVHATAIERRGEVVTRTRLDVDAMRHNAELIKKEPQQLLSLITNEKSVFDKYDVAMTLNRYIDDESLYNKLFKQVMRSPELVELSKGVNSDSSKVTQYSTKTMVEFESKMIVCAKHMGSIQHFEVSKRNIKKAISKHDKAIKLSVKNSLAGKGVSMLDAYRQVKNAGLSDEQKKAIEHVVGGEQITAVVGSAGAGKSTLLAAAREAWEAQGSNVYGAALAGKAAEGLEESSGIESRTLASWEYGFDQGTLQIGSGDVFVIDEAGMVGSKQMSRFVSEIERRGAKLVLVGDHEQLQAIGAGSPFKAIADSVGAVNLQEIRRQRIDWQRGASVDFAAQRTADGLQAYVDNGSVRLKDNKASVVSSIVDDYMADYSSNPDGSRIALAHRHVDVKAINAAIREARQERGDLAKGEEAGELTFVTNSGKRSFACGDRIVFLENNKDLGVKNGGLGSVEAVNKDYLSVKLDGSDGDTILVPMDEYKAIDHGYATTIHKSQGVTVDQSYVMASNTMDRHLTYVSMTRHRDDVKLYASHDEFKNMNYLSSRLSRYGGNDSTLDYRQVERKDLFEYEDKPLKDILRDNPEKILSFVTEQESVFGYGDVSKVLREKLEAELVIELSEEGMSKKSIEEEVVRERKTIAEEANSLASLAFQCSNLVELADDRYSTKEMIALENEMSSSARRMSSNDGFAVDSNHISSSLSLYEDAIKSSVSVDVKDRINHGLISRSEGMAQINNAAITASQKKALEHVTGSEQIAAVVGHAGSSRLALLASACEAWEGMGSNVYGAALSGKAVKALQESTSIQSKTLTSWEFQFDKNVAELKKGDVFVIDEAGMVGSKQMSRMLTEAEKRGAKVVLVGDDEQLQAINAGSAFRAISERIGFVALEESCIQRIDWQRKASTDFAATRTEKGLKAYVDNGSVQLKSNAGVAINSLVSDYMADYTSSPNGSRIALAHRRVDVKAINTAIRGARQELGELSGEEFTFATNAAAINDKEDDGKRSFTSGDRIVFLENNKDLGVKSGLLGTVEEVTGDSLSVRLDGNNPNIVKVDMKEYKGVDHGYATTIHKSQGSTFDRSFVMASSTMDRHLTYVSMTRHRDDVKLYADRDTFKDIKTLTEHLSRSGVKETTLDYTDNIKEERVMKETVLKKEVKRNVARGSGIDFTEISRRADEFTVKENREREVGIASVDEKAISKDIKDSPRSQHDSYKAEKEQEKAKVMARIAKEKAELDRQLKELEKSQKKDVNRNVTRGSGIDFTEISRRADEFAAKEKRERGLSNTKNSRGRSL